MSAPTLKKYCTFSAHDSGAPPDRRDYATLIILHGAGWNSGMYIKVEISLTRSFDLLCGSPAVFDKLFPLVDTLNVRLVAANRPGYQGATPLSDKERMQLNDISKTADHDSELAANNLLDYLRENTKKLCDFLVEFICTEDVPAVGGIVLAGWSLGAVDIFGLLANASAISSKGVDLRSYIKHLILYGKCPNVYAQELK